MTYLKDVYQRFLANHRTAPLAADVSLIYVTSTTQFDKPDAVVTHLSRQAGVVKKKSEQIISAIEGTASLCLDVETTLEFVEGGGVYLPSLDDNFLADRVVTFPTVHIVHFNADHQIQQIRIYWDQGSLLKQVEVIGQRGRSWPIRDAMDQTRLIKAAETAKAAPPTAASEDASSEPRRPSSPSKKRIKDPYAADSLFDLLSPNKAEAEAQAKAQREQEASTATQAPRPSSPEKRHTKDPYAAASLFELLSPTKDSHETNTPRPYAPSTAQPPPREYGELFVSDEKVPESPTRSSQPIAPKVGAGKPNPNRIFGDEVAEDDRNTGEDRDLYKTDPRKYSHFELGHDSAEKEAKEAPKRSAKGRHQSQWDFSDFVNDQAPARAPPTQEARHFDWNDEAAESAEAPPAKPKVNQPRRDAEVHFEMTEDNKEDRSGRMISSYQNRGEKLYENRLWDEHGEAMPSEKEKEVPLSVVSNATNRQNDFGAHWEMTDVSPAPTKEELESQKPVPHDRMKAVKMMESNWEAYDESPQPTKTAPPPQTKIRHHNQPSWTFGDEEM